MTAPKELANLQRALRQPRLTTLVEAARACLANDRIDATSLPCVGEEPLHTDCVWTWNEHCYIVGSCAAELRAVLRGSASARGLGLEAAPKFHRITLPEYRAHVNGYDGLCLACGEWTCGDVEPDAEGYACDLCGEDAVMGAETALVAGKLAVMS